MERDHGQPDADLTRWCGEACATLGHRDLADGLRVFWNPRMRTAAGRAFWPARVIELNPVLHRFGADEVARTLRHELAHLLAHHRAGRRRIQPHGPEWREACAQLGIAGEKACHNLPVARRRQQRRHAYVCTGCFKVTHRVRPFRRAVACHDCCRIHAGGRYDARFRLIPLRQPAAS